MERFRACFADLADPRTGNAQRHDLLEVLLIALCATLVQRGDVRRHGPVRRGQDTVAPSLHALSGQHSPVTNTCPGLLRLLDPEAFEALFGRHVAAFAARVEEVVAIDGKATRSSFDRRPGARRAASGQRLGLPSNGWSWASAGSTDTATRSARPCPELRALLALDGCTVTADAMHCQKAADAAILDRGGDYVLALKTNPPGRCWTMPACCSTIQPHQKTTSPRRSTATMAEVEARLRRDQSRRTWPGWPRRIVAGAPGDRQNPRRP